MIRTYTNRVGASDFTYRVRPHWVLAAGLSLSACALPAEQLALPGPIAGGYGETGALPNPHGTPLGNPATPGAGQPQVYPGSGEFVAEANGERGGSPEPSRSLSVANGEGVTLDLVNASVAEAARTVLGELLGLPYTVSDKVQGQITLQTVKPMSRAALLEVFQSALNSHDAVIVEDQGFHRVVTRTEALNSGRPVQTKAGGPRGPGLATQVVPLRYVAATEMERILRSVAPASAIARADSARNLLILTGSASELASLTETIEVFDVDHMRGMSFGIFPIETSDVEAIAQELDTIFANDREGPTKGIVRFVPNARLKAVLVMTSRPEYLRKAEVWIRRIDQAAEATERRAYVYQVQYRPVQELVQILQRIYSEREGLRDRETRGIRTAGAQGGDQGGPRDATSAGEPGLGAAPDRSLPIRQGGGIVPPIEAAATAAPSPGAGETLALGSPNPLLTGEDDTLAIGAPASALLAERKRDDRLSGISFVADDGNNAIVVSATPAEWRRVRQVLSEIDVMPPQVLIEATIAEVTLTDDLKFGLRWFFEKGGSQFRLTDTLATGTIGAIVPQFAGFAYFLNTTNARVALNVLADITNVNVISSPSLMVLNNKKAVLQIGDQVPIATQQAVATDVPLAPIVNAITFRETGVLLTITPRVSEDGRVLLDIEQEVSDAKETTTSDINSPTIAQRRIKTTVTVANGGSVVLAGLMQDRATRKRQQIPLAGDIPLVGNLFKNKDDEIARTELMIAITPHIVRDQAQTGMIAAEFRDRLNFNTRPQREALPDHKEQFDRIAR